jgi:hypothetical protein
MLALNRSLLNKREETGKYEVKIVVKQAQSGTMIEMVEEIYATNLSIKPSP